MLFLDMDGAPPWRKKQFMYDPKRNKDDGCRNLVFVCWRRGFIGSHAYQVVEKLKVVRHGLQEWR